MIEKILTAIKEATNITPTPFDTDHVDETCIIYKFYQQAFLQYRLEVRVIAKTYATSLEVADKIIKSLNDFGDHNKIKGISSIEQNGGGSLKDYGTDTIHTLIYFDLRCK